MLFYSGPNCEAFLSGWTHFYQDEQKMLFLAAGYLYHLRCYWLRDWDWDWDKFIQHNMTLYRCMISDIHDSSYVLFRTNLISNTSLHVGRPLLRPCLVAYAEATLARQKDSATNEKCWHHFRILIVDKWSVVWNECKKSWVPNDRLEKPLIPCNMISN